MVRDALQEGALLTMKPIEAGRLTPHPFISVTNLVTR
jgi:hypothetical protein